MKFRRTYAAFTLIELLTVIGIIGLIAAVVGPSLTHFRKGDAMLAATRTMLAGVGRARQLAISQHTTVYMVFVPPNFWDSTLYPNATAYGNLPPSEQAKATNILDKQLTGFTFVSLRSIGDQPGKNTPHYLAAWQSLPDKAFIADWKFKLGLNQTLFITDSASGQSFPVNRFSITNNIPFPSDDAPYLGLPNMPRAYVWLPYIAFDYQGRLVSGNGQLLGRDEYIPLAHGSVSPAINSATKKPILGAPSIQEQAPGNSTNSAYNLIHIDWLTGRARLEHQQVK
jgi:prepilin-type N-terminal cleavage/methylation domain-containing protein